jgi:hypothetical protein
MWLISDICEYVNAIHSGVPGRLDLISDCINGCRIDAYPAMIASLVCQAQECTSLMCRIFHKIQGPTSAVQKSCTNIEGILQHC